jgi:hypothetical protein
MTTTIAVDAVVEACWPEDIPRNYEEMYKMYGGFVASTLRKHNKVGRNFEEMLSYIWQRQVEKDVIGLFMQSITDKHKPTMTAVEACSYLGVTWNQWKTKMGAFHKGVAVRSTDGTGRVVARRLGGWMPTPINLQDFAVKRSRWGSQSGFTAKTAIFNLLDIAKLASMERLLANGCVVGPFAKQGVMNHPQLKPTKGHFQSYVATSVYSDFLNWCRTYRRKWSKDRPMYLRADEEGEEMSWEQQLEDPSGVHQENETLVKQAFTKLSEALYSGMREFDVSKLKCKPVEETEMEMFTHLERGMPLPDVVRKLDLPDQVRRAVLRSVADLRSDAA